MSFATIAGSYAVFGSNTISDDLKVVFELVDVVTIRGSLLLDSIIIGRKFTIDSGGLLEASSLNTLANSSVVCSATASLRAAILTFSGTFTLQPNCEFVYTIISVAQTSIVSFESQQGALLPTGSTIALSGSLQAVLLIVEGSLHIPLLSNVYVSFPIYSYNAGCVINVDGVLTAASRFVLTTCSVKGSGRLVILQGLITEKVVSISVNQISISTIFNTSHSSTVHANNATIELQSCVAYVLGSISANASSRLIVLQGSRLTAQNAVLFGFLSIMVHGAAVIINTSMQASHIAFSSPSEVTCAFSTVVAGTTSAAGYIRSILTLSVAKTHTQSIFRRLHRSSKLFAHFKHCHLLAIERVNMQRLHIKLRCWHAHVRLQPDGTKSGLIMKSSMISQPAAPRHHSSVPFLAASHEHILVLPRYIR
jgi:hypothetical protein